MNFCRILGIDVNYKVQSCNNTAKTQITANMEIYDKGKLALYQKVEYDLPITLKEAANLLSISEKSVEDLLRFCSDFEVPKPGASAFAVIRGEIEKPEKIQTQITPSLLIKTYRKYVEIYHNHKNLYNISLQ